MKNGRGRGPDELSNTLTKIVTADAKSWVNEGGSRKGREGEGSNKNDTWLD